MIKKISFLAILTLIFTLLAPIQSASALATPSGLSATGNRNGDYSEGSVTVSWTPVAAADNGYAIQTLLNGVQVGGLTGAPEGASSAVEEPIPLKFQRCQPLRLVLGLPL